MKKKLARTIEEAWELREESYVKPSERSSHGAYAMSMEDAIVQAMQNIGVHANWLTPLMLMFMFPNETNDWAKEMLR